MADLRKPFFQTMGVLAANDPNVILLTGDLGFSFYEEYARRFPNQFINAGCAEQSMVGIAAGLAQAGKRPFVYSGAVFLVMRAKEQIRDDVAFNGTDVCLVGTGAAGFLGFTHNLAEGESVQASLAGLPMAGYYPENEKALELALTAQGPRFVKI